MGRSDLVPPLTVSGNRIIEASSGRPVTLRGVNRSGLEYCSPDGDGSLAKAGITETEIDHIVNGWRANVIRLPLNQAWALERPEPYLAAVDWVIDTAAQRGAYVLIDLHWLDATTVRGVDHLRRPNFVPPLPDAGSLLFWQMLAGRYRDQPAVLFDVFNEPHDPLPGDDLVAGPVTAERWQSHARTLIEAIRAEHPDALIFVPGIDWGYDLRGSPIPGMNGVVYSTHVYRNKGIDWDAAFGNLANYAPVFAGEFGGAGDDVEWGERLIDYLEARSIGWAAWSWSDWPHLILKETGPRFLPTRFGAMVQSRMRGG